MRCETEYLEVEQFRYQQFGTWKVEVKLLSPAELHPARRSRLSAFAWVCGVLLIGVLFVEPCRAQRAASATRTQASRLQAAGGNAGGLETVELEGELEAVAGERLKIKASDGTDVFVVLTAKTRVSYGAVADSKFLRAGLMVRFDADFDTQQGVAVNPISVIDVFQPSRGRMTVAERQNQTAGIYPITEDPKQAAAGAKDQPSRNVRGNAAKNTKATARKDQKAADNAAGADDVSSDSVKPFRVVGQLQVIQDSKLRVVAGRQAIVVDLADDVQVQVVAGDALFCKPGDQVKLKGLRNASQPSLVQAAEVEIMGKQPLGEALGAKASGNTANDANAGSKKTLSRRRTRGKLGKDD